MQCNLVVQLDPIPTDISAFAFVLFIIFYLPSWFYPQDCPDHAWPVERWRRFGSSRFGRNSSCVQLRKLRKLPNTVFCKFRAEQCSVLCCPVTARDISVVTKGSSPSPVCLSCCAHTVLQLLSVSPFSAKSAGLGMVAPPEVW